MNAIEFCGEHAIELSSGKITFSKKHINQFINTYTYLESKDFTKENRNRLVSFLMVNLYNQAISKYSLAKKEICPDKIEVPMVVFQ